MQVNHIVLLQFKEGVTPENKVMVRTPVRIPIMNKHPHQSNQVATKVRNLREECRHPETGKAYIVSLTAGTDVSIEGLQVRNPGSHLVNRAMLLMML